MIYVTMVHLCLPHTDPQVFTGMEVEMTDSEPNEIGKRLASFQHGSITLANGTELVLPAGVFQHVYFTLEPVVKA